MAILSLITRHARAIGAALLLAIGFAPPATAAEHRLALVIANGAYTAPGLGRLPGTRRDADLIAAALRDDGFSVRIAPDLADKEAMRAELASFVRDLANAGPDTVGFLYYTGYGIADAAHGENYLIPVHAPIRSTVELTIYAEPMEEVVSSMAASGAKAVFVVFDACRDTVEDLSKGAKGLQPMRPRADTLVAFATAAGTVAQDDGLYASVLATKLRAPGLFAAGVLDEVQAEVATRTNRTQVPEFTSRLVSRVQFALPGGNTTTDAQSRETAGSANFVSPQPQLAGQSGTPNPHAIDDCMRLTSD